MNVENMNQLKTWLEDGARHAFFNMHTGIEDVEIAVEEGLEVEGYGKGDCGTVCCIAGAAQMMSHAEKGEIFPSMDIQSWVIDEFQGWDSTLKQSSEWLGIDVTSSNTAEDPDWFGHDLFNPASAPKNCTPQQAAQAVQNVIDGKPAWEGIS